MADETHTDRGGATPAPAPPPITVDARSELVTLIRLSWPIALAQFGLVALNLVDTAIIGPTSVEDLAATATGRSIAFATISIAMGASLALEPLASQAVGANEPARAYGALRASLAACAILALPALALTFASTLILAPMGIDPALIPRIRVFLIGYAPGAVAFLAFLAGKTYLQAHGVTRPALVGAIVTNVVNVIVCNLLVRGDDFLRSWGLPALGLPRLGAFGAGLAGSISTLLLAAIVLVAARRLRPPTVERVAIMTVLRIGMPVGLQLGVEIGVFSVVALIAGRLGSNAVAAHQIALGLASFTFMGALGVSGATAVRVGNAVGAGTSPRRAGLFGLLLGACAMTIGAVTFTAAPRWLMGLFTRDADVIATGETLLRIAALFQLFDGVQVVAAGALRGLGDVKFPFYANVGAHWLVGLPVALALCFGAGLGAAGLWWGLTAGLVTVAALLTARFLVLSKRKIARL